MTSCKRILVIDDEPDIREIARLSLTLTKSWETLTAASGPEGIDMAAAQAPDAILLDMMMPEMDGLATLTMLKANPTTCNIPVLLLTAAADVADNQSGDGQIAQGILSKPFDPGTLGEQIAMQLGW